MNNYQAIVSFPGFSVGICATADDITGVDYLPPTPEKRASQPLAIDAARQMGAYRKHPSFAFGLPLRPQGTHFQRRVWSAITDIPCGQVKTYGQVATHLHSGPRAVGGACGANPYPLIVPCHRVISATGLGGFGGVGGDGVRLDFLLTVKRWLLTHEGHASF